MGKAEELQRIARLKNSIAYFVCAASAHKFDTYRNQPQSG
jgi:hypothetical protein